MKRDTPQRKQGTVAECATYNLPGKVNHGPRTNLDCG
jgi:hypothetical protein